MKYQPAQVGAEVEAVADPLAEVEVIQVAGVEDLEGEGVVEAEDILMHVLLQALMDGKLKCTPHITFPHIYGIYYPKMKSPGSLMNAKDIGMMAKGKGFLPQLQLQYRQQLMYL